MSTQPRIEPCKGCGAKLTFLPTASGKRMPVLAESLNGWHEGLQFDATKHRSHFADCPAAAKFRKPREKKPVRDEFSKL